MKLTINDSQLRDFNRQLGLAGKVFDKRFLGSALRVALKPVAQLARQQAPKRAVKTRNGLTRIESSLSNSVRILIVDGDGPDGVKGLVGISRKKGKAGYRAAPIIRGTTSRRTRKGYNRGSIRPNDFLGRTQQLGTPLVISSLSDSAQVVVRKALQKYI